jgi:hypothetical protein
MTGIDCMVFVELWLMAVVAIIEDDCIVEIDWERATVDADSMFCDDIDTVLEWMDVWLTDVVRLELVPSFLLHE